MEAGNLVIVDEDRDYIERFMNYFYSKQKETFECQAFTDVSMLLDCSRERRIDVLLISSELINDEVLRIPAASILVLGEEGTVYHEENIRSVNRYQSTDGIIREIMKSRSESETDETSAGHGLIMGDIHFTAVYSPVKRSFRTTFAVTLGQLLSDRGKTLYINLEECSGFSQMFQIKYEADISDLLFFMKGRKDNFLYKLQSMVMNTHGLDYIPPVMAASDIISVSEDDWMGFFDAIAGCGYENAVIDLGDNVQGTERILEKCGTIYMPVRQGSIARAKVAQFEAMLHMTGREELLGRIKKLELPFDEKIGSFAGECRNTGLADYARILIGEN